MKRKCKGQGVVVHALGEVDAGGSRTPDHPGLHSETLTQKRKRKKIKKKEKRLVEFGQASPPLDFRLRLQGGALPAP